MGNSNSKQTNNPPESVNNNISQLSQNIKKPASIENVSEANKNTDNKSSELFNTYQKDKLSSPQSSPQTLGSPLILQKQLQMPQENSYNSEMFSLMLYQMTKQNNCIFNQDQKNSIVYCTSGCALTLLLASLSNIADLMLKPLPQYKKYFFAFGGANIISSIILIYLGYNWSKQLYYKVPKSEWNRIQTQREQFDKLSFFEKGKYLQEKNTQDKRQLQIKKQKLLQQARKLRQQKLDSTK